MPRTLIVRGRRTARRTVWEAHRVNLLMEVGGEYCWIRMEDIICVSGKFSEAFAAMRFPGFPEYDADNPDIERALVYQGLNIPTPLEIEQWLEEQLRERMRTLREHFNSTGLTARR